MKRMILIFLISVIACGNSAGTWKLCQDVQDKTNLQIEQEFLNRQMSFDSMVDDVVIASDGTYLVFVFDTHIGVRNVPEEIATKLNKGDQFKFTGILTRFSRLCYGSVQYVGS